MDVRVPFAAGKRGGIVPAPGLNGWPWRAALVLLALLATFGAATARDLVTITGGGPIGDGGPATGAYLQDLSSIVRDADGNVYIGEGNSARVRRVDAITGDITTYAGTGELGFSGDGGDATDAHIDYPYGLAVDGDGNLYISEGIGNRVRKVTPGGTISTVAGTGVAGYSGDGGAATSAQLNSPHGLAVDADGNLFIADEANSLIRRVDAITQEITTVAGDGTADFYGDGGPATAAALNFPADVEVDGAGNLYISDTGNSRVRRVDAGTQDISTFAGDGGCCFNGLGGPATAANVGAPLGISLAADGSLFIVDQTVQGVLKVDAVNNLVLVGGGNGSGYSGDGGPANDGQFSTPMDVEATTGDDFLVADAVNHRIRIVASGTLGTFAGGTALLGDGGPATAANVMSPYDIMFDEEGHLYFTDRGGQTVRRIDAGTGVISTVAGSGLTGLVNGAPASAQFRGPTRLISSPDGAVLIADRSNNVLRVLNADGDEVFNLSTPGGNPIVEGATMVSSRFAGPNGFAFSPDLSYLYIASTNSNRIRRWDILNDAVTTIAGTGAFDSTGDGGPAINAEIAQPFSLAVDASGNIYFNEINHGRIRRITPGGTISTIAGNGSPGSTGDGGQATDAQITPHSVTIGPDGALYFSQNANCAIRRVDLGTGVITRFAGTGTCGVGPDGPALTTPLNQPFGIAWSGDSLYLAEIGNSRIRRVQPDPPVQVSIGDASVVEGNAGFKYLNFPVTLSAAYESAVSFNASTSDGTATVANADYVALVNAGQVIPAGNTSGTIAVRINGDTVQELNETLQVSLSNFVGGVAVDGTAVGTIINNDGPALSIGDKSITEGRSGTRTIMFQVTLAAASATPVTFDVATFDGTALAGSDYVANSQVGVTIAPGATSAPFSVTINGDTAPESTETFGVLVSNVVGATVNDPQATGTILDGGSPTLSIADRSISEGQSGTRMLTFLVRINAASASPVTFDIATADGSATAGSDYVATSTTGLTIPAGSTSVGFAVTINGDTIPESSETFTVTATNASGATIGDGQATGTLLDAGGVNLSIRDKSITEGQSGTKLMNFTVSLSGVSGSPVTFDIGTADGTALAGSDYVATSATGVTIAPGITTSTFSVTINGDLTAESLETFLVNVSNVAGASVTDAQAIGSINDGGSLTASILDRAIVEGSSGYKTLSFSVRLSAASASPVTFDVATSDGTATAADSDYLPIALVNQTIPAGGILKAFTVRVYGDVQVEGSEVFNVNVSNLSGAAMVDTTALGTITNDD